MYKKHLLPILLIFVIFFEGCKKDTRKMSIHIVSETHTTKAVYIVVEILDLGGHQFLKYGVCYNLTNDSPTISDCVISKTINTTGTYSIEVDNLSPAVTYYFKAFLESSNEVVYSEVKKITLNKSVTDYYY